MGRPSLGWWSRMMAGSPVVLVPAGAGRATCESCCVGCCNTIVVWAAGSRASAQLQCVLPRRLELGAEGAPKGKGSAEGHATKDRGLPEQDPPPRGLSRAGAAGEEYSPAALLGTDSGEYVLRGTAAKKAAKTHRSAKIAVLGPERAAVVGSTDAPTILWSETSEWEVLSMMPASWAHSWAANGGPGAPGCVRDALRASVRSAGEWTSRAPRASGGAGSAASLSSSCVLPLQ